MDINNSAHEHVAAAPQKSIPIPTFFKYSKRVLLKDVINNGPDFVGQRVVVGGWVKSSREIKTETPTNPSMTSAQMITQQPNKDFDCVEILQTKLPFFRSFFKVFGIAHYPVRDKPEPHNIPKLPHQPSLAILQISDGSSVANLQVLVESSLSPTSQIMATGTCILVDGLLQQPSFTKNAGKHAIELKVVRVLHIGMVHQDTYPLSKKKFPLHLLRDCAHFRPRTTTVGSVARIRSALNEGSHNFFQLNGFLFVQVPIITATDAEGSSQKFQVTTLNLGIFRSKELLEKDREEQKGANRSSSSRDDSNVISLETIKASMKEKIKQLDELKRSDSNREAVVAATKDLHKTTELAAQMEAARSREEQRITTVPGSRKKMCSSSSSSSDNDFFGRQAYLTVSGRLHLQSYACALGNVYSCGPRFRAERMESKRFVSETWMTEVEIAFSELEDAISCAEDLVKHACKWALDNCMEDLQFLSKRVDQLILDRLKSNIEGSFQRMSYSEALEILNEVKEKKHESKVEWGESFTEEHEICLAEEICKKGVVIYNHPKQIKPFYVRLNDDGKTVASFDIIMPKGGKVISGCQNEERNAVVKERIKEMWLKKKLKEEEVEEEEQYEWYLELTRQGSVKSSGFTMVFDLLSIHATGLIDVRDVIPFSRTSGQLINN